MNAVSVNLYGDESELSEAICNFVIARSVECVEERGRFTIALTADCALSLFSKRAIEEPFLSFVDWSKWWIFFIDDFCLPLTHSKSNYRKCNDMLLQHVSIPENQVFPEYDPSADLDDKGSTCESAALRYEKQVNILV